MDDGGPTASYVIFFVLLLIEMIFYGFGAAARELSTKDLSDQVQEGNKRAEKLYKIAVNPEQYINTVQLIITLINLIMGVSFLRMFSLAMERLLEGSAGVYLENRIVLTTLAFILSGALLLYVLLAFGVLIPKRLGIRYASKIAYTCINPVYFVVKLFSPLTGIVSVTVALILRLFGIHENDNQEDVTEEEIISMVNEGHEQGVLLATEAAQVGQSLVCPSFSFCSIFVPVLPLDRNISELKFLR